MKKYLYLLGSALVLVALAGASCGYNYPAATTQPTSQPPLTVDQNANEYTTQPQANQPTAVANNITIQNFAFNPATLTVKAGTTVTWNNQDSAPHQLTSSDLSDLSSNALSNGDTYSYTFNQKGTFNYNCKIHPSMTGQIIVE